MEYEIVEKNRIPKPKPLITEKELLYQALKDLPVGKAMKITCRSWEDLQRRRSTMGNLSSRLFKEEGLRLATQKYEVQLSEKRRASYERSNNKGGFKRECYLYVWKVKPEEG